MRTGGVPAALFLLLASVLLQVSTAGDIYLEGEEDPSNEFLEVKEKDHSITDHLNRLKRQWNPFSFFAPPKEPEPEAEADTATDNPGSEDTLPDDKDDGLDNFGSGVPDKPESESREKTLRVTFVVMEPYRTPAYTNRDSPEFQAFSGALANAVDLLFESLPGTQRASLVRIQSRLHDEFSCKVTLDIVTRDYDDTERIKDLLRDHIKNNGRLGNVSVVGDDFSAQLIDPAAPSPDDVTEEQNGYDSQRGDDNGGGEQKGFGNGADQNSYDNGADQNGYDNGDDQTGYDNGADQNGYDNGGDQNEDDHTEDDTISSTERNVGDTNGYSNRGDQPGLDNGGVVPGYDNQPEEADNDNNKVDQNSYDTSYDQRGESTDTPYTDNETPVDNSYDQSLDTTGYDWSPYGTTRAPQTRRCENPIPCSSSAVTFCPEQRCDETLDCPLGEDEQDCPGAEPEVTTRRETYEDTTRRLNEDNDVEPPFASNIVCPSDHMRCDETRCVLLASRCDGRRDCVDGTDEAGCPDGKYLS